jgi:hypothetical protein
VRSPQATPATTAPVVFDLAHDPTTEISPVTDDRVR